MAPVLLGRCSPSDEPREAPLNLQAEAIDSSADLGSRLYWLALLTGLLVGAIAAGFHALIDRLGALTIASEVGDWRRFPAARTFMGFTGLVPSEYSTGESVRRGRITKAGNAHLRTQLIESAWAYQHRPNVGAVLRRRQDGVDPATTARSWTAQQRLCSRFRRLSARKTSRNVVTVAVARELAGFLWAEMTAA